MAIDNNKLKQWLEEKANYHLEELEKLTDEDYDYHYHAGYADACDKIWLLIKKGVWNEDK